MIGLDTNVLVRHIMQDDPVQSLKATNWIEHRLTQENPGFITVVTLVETAWVLERAFGYSSREIGRVIERILQIETLCIQSEKEIHAAMLIAKLGTGSFADALVGEPYV